MSSTKRCPYCAEEIRVEAVRCRYCRSRLTSFAADRWHRAHLGARIAGVCVALANVLAVPVGIVRLTFIVLTFIHFVGPLAYAALWLVIPSRPGALSVLERVLQAGLSWAAVVGSRAPSAPASQGPPARSDS